MPKITPCAIFALTLLSGSPLQTGAAEIVERSEWDAREPQAGLSTYEEYALDVPPYETVVLHVTSMGYGSGPEEMQRIQNFQMDVRGFADIAYNFLIDAEGSIFEGRSLRFVPAHAGRSREADAARDIRMDPDYGAIGIAFSADTDQPLTPAQVSAAIELINRLRQSHPAESVITHTEIREQLESRGLTPLGEFLPNDCPGPGSVQQIIDIRLATDPGFDPVRYRDRFN